MFSLCRIQAWVVVVDEQVWYAASNRQLLQDSHCAEPTPLKSPASQGVHVEASAAEKVPAGQKLQLT